MAARYDAEQFLADIETRLKAYLNTKITAISAEKADGMELKAIDADAFFFQTLNDKCANFNPFILYGITDSTGQSAGPYVSMKVTAEIAIIVADTGQDQEIGKRLLRYSRALEEVCSDAWDKIRSGVRLNVTSLAPVSFALANSSEAFKAVGVRIEAELA